MSDREWFIDKLAQLNTNVVAVSNALWAINDRLKPLDNAIDNNTLEVSKWLAMVAEAIAKIQPLPQPQPNQLEVNFVFIVKNDHQDEPFAIAIGSVTDVEGEILPDTSSLVVEVASSDAGVVSATFDPATNSGVASFGHSGVAALTATVKNAKGDILGSGAADFTVTTGDPAAVSNVSLSFSGLTEEPPAPVGP